MTSQAVGLAEAVGLPFDQKTIGLKLPWRWLPGHLCPGALRFGLTRQSSPLVPPWPDLLIVCGRRSQAVAIAIRRLSGGKTLTVYVQDPKIPARYFDLVVPPRHDGLEGPNVMPTRGALHRITHEKLAEAAARQTGRFAHLSRPLVTVLLGGSSRSSRLTPEISAALGRELARLVREQDVGLAITASRRTGPENLGAFRAALGDVPHFLWDGEGENPYLAMLGLADYIVVTGDSVSMVSEAASTGKPVYVVDLEGYSNRLKVFHQELRREGITRPFPGPLERWVYEPVNDTARVAGRIRQMLAARGLAGIDQA
ncbi:mitochondrial fission ELM1 family protein [Thioalkalivibrio sulfidiphilus]|nr:mitochondrial fission ELM1 family protein [Thioalkalivibrio sulfidiphilus]